MIYIRWCLYSFSIFVFVNVDEFVGLIFFGLSYSFFGNILNERKRTLLIFTNQFLQFYAIVHLFSVCFYIANKGGELINSSVLLTVLIIIIPFIPDLIKKEIEDFKLYRKSATGRRN